MQASLVDYTVEPMIEQVDPLPDSDTVHIPVHRVHGFQRIVIADSRRT